MTTVAKIFNPETAEQDLEQARKDLLQANDNYSKAQERQIELEERYEEQTTEADEMSRVIAEGGSGAIQAGTDLTALLNEIRQTETELEILRGTTVNAVGQTVIKKNAEVEALRTLSGIDGYVSPKQGQEFIREELKELKPALIKIYKMINGSHAQERALAEALYTAEQAGALDKGLGASSLALTADRGGTGSHDRYPVVDGKTITSVSTSHLDEILEEIFSKAKEESL